MCNRLERGCAVTPKTTVFVQTSCSNLNNAAWQRLQLALALNLKRRRPIADANNTTRIF